MYATHDDLVARHGEEAVTVTFDRESIGAVDSAAETQALDDASAEIDGYLAGVYSLPLATVPRILVFMACDIAMYRGAVGSVVTEECRKRFEDAIKFLTRVAEGKIKLFASDPSAPNGGSGASFDAGGRLFTRDSMKDVR